MSMVNIVKRKGADNQWLRKVNVAKRREYNVILASVTYFKAEVGDEITLVVPDHGESEWGAIENVIPKINNDKEEELF